MREALRRALWILPTLFVVSVLSFWISARNTPPPPGEESLPVLFNANPHGIESLAWTAALSAAAESGDAKRAKELLWRLGGAALPVLLPKFDSLNPADRRRLALALLPVAHRMQIPEATNIEDPEEAETFWLQFWQDHFVDFKPTVSRRVVSRFGARSTSLRQSELLRLDTYALEELMTQMGETEDPSVLRRLCAAASHIAEKRWFVETDASPKSVATTVELWQAWWARHQNKYTEPVGAERLLAPVLQTRYVLWLKEAVRTRFGKDRAGVPLLSVLLHQAPLTLGLLATGLLLGSLLGLTIASMARASGSRPSARGARLLALCWLGTPTVTFVGLLETTASSSWAVAWATILVVGSSAAIAHLHAKDALDAEPAPLDCPSILRSTWLQARAAARQTLRGATSNAPTVLGIVLLVEYGFDLRGWGRETIRAVLERDVAWLMLMVMATATILGLIHVLVAIGEAILGSDRKEALHNV